MVGGGLKQLRAKRAYLSLARGVHGPGGIKGKLNVHNFSPFLVSIYRNIRFGVTRGQLYRNIRFGVTRGQLNFAS